ncbi:hypothetical protein EX895_001299 [Sporisorium graminicola]|uniref:Transcription factor domain-containing protein n=1 Tax=Sporisorium graminicola TaxID=280036 RepID=A0A4U7KYP7_9BASI|nr:hypothetical protein EX895_001299 [Sporisorium graminicola]TKY90001.1 hypothetical protein EX895_001299 [Sporisorium graminicola]
MDTFEKTLAYFDPRLCTFDYIHSRSQSLLSVICFIVARVEPEFDSIARQLDHHVHQTVYPAILAHGFRSVEIVQALLLLAAFASPSENVREDRSWSLLSHAARVASEINLQACLSSRRDEHATRATRLEQRHAQRAWLNLWLHEFSLAQHTGRHSILAEQDLFSSCRDWHLDPLARDSDVALVSMVELRTIIKRNRHLFSLLPPGNDLFYAEQCKSQLRTWSQTWQNALPLSASISRLELSRLYVSHALVQLLGLVLHHQAKSQWPPSIVMDLYEASSTYLDVFPQRLAADRLVYCYNSMWVAASYQVIVAVRLAQLSSTFTFIDGTRLLQQCYRVYDCFSRAANQSIESTAPHCYLRFLGGVLRSLSHDAPPGATEEADTVSSSLEHSPNPDPIAETLVQLSQGQQPCAMEAPPSDMLAASELDPLLGFDDLEFFAWAGASLAQNDNFDT